MPELPSLERGRRLVADFLVGKTVETCSAREIGGGKRTGKFDEVIFGQNETGITYSTIEKQLTGATIEGVSRKGKFVWFRWADISTRGGSRWKQNLLIDRRPPRRSNKKTVALEVTRSGGRVGGEQVL